LAELGITTTRYWWPGSAVIRKIKVEEPCAKENKQIQYDGKATAAKK
jgi:hypothetical protein